MSDFKSFVREWKNGYEEAKQDNGHAEYVGMTILISGGTLLIIIGLAGLLLALLDAAFWYIIAGLAYTGLASIFGWPTPLSLIKKLFKK